MWGFVSARLGFRCIDELLDMTLNEYSVMYKAFEDSTKTDLEFQFYMQKRAIGEAMSGKGKGLFEEETETMTREDNHNKFKEFSEMFNKNKSH